MSRQSLRPNGNSPTDVDELGADIGPTLEDNTSKSPLLTSHRVSVSSLDEVQLGGLDESSSTRSRSTTTNSSNSVLNHAKMPPKLPSRSQGLSGSLPTIPWGPPPSVPSKPTTPTPTPAAQSRKLTSPFTWLSRNTSATKETVPPVAPQPIRHSTVSSLATVDSNPELMLGRLDEGNESDSLSPVPKRLTKNTLRDRFKLLRMREEAGIRSLDAQGETSPDGGGGALAGLIGRSASLGLGIGSPTSVVDEREGGLAGSPAQSPTSTVPPALHSVSSVNPELAPGTASGMSAGVSVMSDPAAPVDWDLWQTVVYEGPAAVARTSPEELSRAIASGIPSAIRGVVWQVLAQSKNEELEGVYRDLVVRGTDKDRDLASVSSAPNSANSLLTGNSKEKNSVASSASSIHSDHSTPATTATNGMASPSSVQEKDGENIVKLQAAVLAERKKKAKEDVAEVQKLEKCIKRDLGARTSYSKYAVAAGLQDGLFGVCKAYALFDEGVGYAQGMNFLVMPLLFNVSLFSFLIYGS